MTARTLADMTPAERAECVGMWSADGPDQAIIGQVNAHGVALLIYPDTRQTRVTNPHEVKPRFDLPRAWTPDGKPVPGDSEHAVGYVLEYADGQKDCRPRYREDSRQSALRAAEDMKDDGYVAMRRFVTGWEEA